MSIITRITSIFSTSIPRNPIGIALRAHSTSYFSGSSTENKCGFIKNSGQGASAFLPSLFEDEQLTGQCHIVLSNAQSQIVQVDKPTVPAEEINAALKWQIKDLVTIAPEEMVLDYFDGPILSGGVEKINVVCSKKSELIELVSSLTTGESEVSTITTEEFAFAGLLPTQQDAVLMVCQQPNEEVNLLIIKNGQLFFSRRLRGFSQISEKTEGELTMGVIDSLSLEIQRSTDYFERQLKQAPIKTIEVLLPINNEAFIARKLAENTNVEVCLFSMPEGLEQERKNAVAIGATQLNYMEATANG